jgi:hypothetical protein
MSQEWSRGERRRNHFRSRCARRGGAGRVFPATAAIALLLLVDAAGKLTRSCVPRGSSSPACGSAPTHKRSTSCLRFVCDRGGGARQSKAGVVLANQSDRDLCSWLRFARSLSRAGFGVLLFDYSGADPQADVAAAAQGTTPAGSALDCAHRSLGGGSSGARGWQPAYSGRGRRRQSLRREQGAYGPPRIVRLGQRPGMSPETGQRFDARRAAH